MAVVWGFLDSTHNKAYAQCKCVCVIRAEMEHPPLNTFDLYKRKGFQLSSEELYITFQDYFPEK